MTRVNLIPPTELTSQHLFSEFRELKMIPKALDRSIRAFGVEGVKARIPTKFTLNTGHVSHFYDKLLYLDKRYAQLCKELDKRNINYNKSSVFDVDRFKPLGFYNDWVPTQDDVILITTRINERIAMKPEWYRY